MLLMNNYYAKDAKEIGYQGTNQSLINGDDLLLMNNAIPHDRVEHLDLQ